MTSSPPPISRRYPAIEGFAVPAVSLLIIFLAYTSQFLFYYIEPGPLSRKDTAWFNGLVLGIWWCYAQACKVDPGPKGWVEAAVDDSKTTQVQEEPAVRNRLRWCKKCEAVKPPRAHHCKQCGRCVPKMDHHCPWTTNCVSQTTFPHFIRFVLYAVLSMSILAYHLLTRAYFLWECRNLPSYLGPPTWAMAHLMVLLVVNGLVLFALGILLVRAVYSLATNTSMIESWEIDRHEALVERARKTGGFVYANGGQRMRIEKQEFPYDIGFWKNMCQGMGTSNVFMWFMPFSRTPSSKTAIDWEVNGFEDESKVWPPPDPDKMPRLQRRIDDEVGEVQYRNMRDEIEAFKRRQQKDLERWNTTKEEESEEDEDEGGNVDGKAFEDKPHWTNSDGDRLSDFGVDEEAELTADDEIPLGELLRRRKARSFEQ